MLTLLLALASSQSLAIKDEGVSQGWVRTINCTGSGVTCTVNTATRVATFTSSGGVGGGVPDSIPALTYTTSADLSQERVLSAGNYTAIDLDTPSQAQVDWTHGLTCSSGQALTSSGTTAMTCTSTLTASDVACAGTCIADGEIAGVAGAKVSGAVATASALAANPTDCGASQYATAIDASGNLTCAAVSVSGLPQPDRITIANYTNSTTGFTDTPLSWSVANGTAYILDCVLYYTTAASTTALHVSLLGPTTSTLRYHVNTETTTTAAHAATQTVYDTVTNPATGSGAVPLAVYLNGSLTTTAAGTLTVRAKSEVNASVVTILTGSWCVLTSM